MTSWRPRARLHGRATSSCSLPPARATTCSTTTNTAAPSSSGSRPPARPDMQVLEMNAPTMARRAVAAPADVRLRWRMGPEARGLVLVSAVLTAFGLAVLYSASAFVAMNDHGDSSYFLVRQLVGVAAGMVAFTIAAKVDAERLHGWAWPIMWFTIAAMLAVLVLPNRIAPVVHGSRRFLFGGSFQPSEFGKLAVVLWCSMLIVR